MEDSSPRQEYMVKQIQAQVLEEWSASSSRSRSGWSWSRLWLYLLIKQTNWYTWSACSTPLQVMVEDILPGQVQVMS